MSISIQWKSRVEPRAGSSCASNDGRNIDRSRADCRGRDRRVCCLVVGCQTPPFDHVDSASTAFNANHMPTADRHGCIDGRAHHKRLRPRQRLPVKARHAASATPSAGGNESAIVENLNLGHREAALNRLDQAEAYYRRVLELQPDNPVANHRLAVIADKKHDYARAEHYYLAALQREPRNPDLLGDSVIRICCRAAAQESERYLHAATQLDPSHAKALHNLSLLYAMNGDYDRSFDALRRAVGESEARAKIARLFPQGRPQASDSEAVVASFQPMSARECSARPR